MQEISNQERLRTIFDLAGVGLVETDADARIVAVNSRMLEMLGYTRDELLGRSVVEITYEDDRPVAEKYNFGLLENPEAVFAYDKRYVRRDGTPFWVNVHVNPVLDGGGRVRGLIGTVVDIEERVRAEQSLREREEQLRDALEREAAANRTKDAFLANLSHELRTPLNVILGYARMLTNESDPERGRRLAGIILNNARAQLRIVEDLLDIQRIVAGRMHVEYGTVNLKTLGQQVIDSLAPQCAAKRLHCRADLAPVVFEADPARLQQVLWNLLANAIKFTPADGCIGILGAANDEHVIVRVEDSGEGIPRHFLPHVFERFRQLDMSASRRHFGMGLGLAIVKTVVELHGGTVTADSPGEGRGSVFEVRLPKVRPRSVAPGAEQGGPLL